MSIVLLRWIQGARDRLGEGILGRGPAIRNFSHKPLQLAAFPDWSCRDVGDQSRDRLSGLGQDDLLAPADLFEKPGEVSLRLLDIDLFHTKQTNLDQVAVKII